MPNPFAFATNPVTLNLFQGPSGRALSAKRRGGVLVSSFASQCSGNGAKWTLKQVQGDDNGNGFI